MSEAWRKEESLRPGAKPLQVDDEFVLVDMSGNGIFVLKPVATRLWEFVSNGWARGATRDASWASPTS
jgi:hypothetical protein